MLLAARRVGACGASAVAVALAPRQRPRCDERLVRLPTALSLKTAGRIAESALAGAEAHGLHPLAVVVVDAGGGDVLALREDGCGVLRTDVARGKAYACLAMGMSSRAIRDRLADRPTFLNALSDVARGRFARKRRGCPSPGERSPSDPIAGCAGPRPGRRPYRRRANG